MRTIDVVYSPICEANGAFLGYIEEWLQGTDVNINYISYDNLNSKETEWYKREGMINNEGKPISSIFIDVFYNGRLIDSVPLKRERIEEALHIDKKGKSVKKEPHDAKNKMDIKQFRDAIFKNEIEFIPITLSNYKDEMTMCIENYPYGNPPLKYHKRCIELKDKVFCEVFKKEDIAGIYAKYYGKVIGLIEVLPREIIRKYGFLTGSKGKDEDYLTVGCYEIGYGVPRKEMIDELMFHLEEHYLKFKRKHIEGIGVFEWSEGFNPYWVYDKYGFRRQESIANNMIVMEKKIKADIIEK